MFRNAPSSIRSLVVVLPLDREAMPSEGVRGLNLILFFHETNLWLSQVRRYAKKPLISATTTKRNVAIAN